MTRRGWALFAAMCVIWGIPYLLIRVAVRDVEPGTLVFLRTAIGGLVLLPFALARGGFGPVLRRWRPLLAFTVLEMAVPWLLLSDAETKLSSSLSGLLIAAVPLVGVLVARVNDSDEPADWLQLVGLLVGLLGVTMLVGLDFGEISATALVEVLGVVIGYAVAPAIMARRLADLPSIPVCCASLLLVAIGYAPYAALRPPTSASGHAWLSITVLGLICTALAFILFFALIGDIGPSRAVVITYVNPAVAVLFGVWLLGERFTTGMAVGFPLILAGSVLAARRRTAASTSVPEAMICENAQSSRSASVARSSRSASVAQSIRTDPKAVSNSAPTTPVRSSSGATHSTATSPNGSSAGPPR